MLRTGGWGPQDGVSALARVLASSLCSLSPVKMQLEGGHLQFRKDPHQNPDHAGALISDSQLLEL